MRQILRYLSFGCVAVLLVADATRAAEPVTNKKPVIEQEGMNVVPGDMLDDFWKASEVVVRVHIEAQRVRGIGNTPIVFTEHHATVVRSFKGNLKAGARLVFLQHAGTLELPDRIIHVSQKTPLSVGSDYLVFLRQRDDEPSYTLIGDNEGAFRFDRGAIKPEGYGAFAEGHRNLSEKRFIDEIERTASHQKEMR